MIKLILIFVLFGLVLGVRFSIYFENTPQLRSGEELSFETTLLSDSRQQSYVQRLIVRFEGREKIFISTSRFPTYSYGQKLLIEGTVEETELDSGGTIYTMSYPVITLKRETNPVILLSKTIRERVISVFTSILPYPSSSLLIGIVFGIKEQMPEQLTDKLIQTGIIHITAASGMNVTLLAGAVFLLFGSLLKRSSAICFSLIIVWVYAVIAGFDASIVRASVMASIAFSASLLGRQNIGWYALFLTAFLMLFLNPSTLFDIGFQLSIASTWGILFLVPLMGRKSTVQSDLWFLSDDFKATTAAQIATIPIMLVTFGSYGLFSIPINLLVLWTIPFLMILGSISAFFSFTLPALAVPVLYLSLPFLVYIEYIVTFGSELLPSITVQSISASFIIGYYVVLFSVMWFLYQRKKQVP